MYMDVKGLACGSGWSEYVVPDRPGGCDFSRCCQRHDDCYGDCNKEKKDCDDEFYDCMLKECMERDNQQPTPILPDVDSFEPDDTLPSDPLFILIEPNISECLSIAKQYKNAVDALGGGPYEDAQECCP